MVPRSGGTMLRDLGWVRRDSGGGRGAASARRRCACFCGRGVRLVLASGHGRAYGAGPVEADSVAASSSWHRGGAGGQSGGNGGSDLHRPACPVVSIGGTASNTSPSTTTGFGSPLMMVRPTDDSRQLLSRGFWCRRPGQGKSSA
jgi:hypothetical protein